MVLLNKDVQFSVIEVTLLHRNTITDYLYFFEKRYRESLIYDAKNNVYRSFIPYSADDEVPPENIEKYILRQTEPVPNEHDLKLAFEYNIRCTFNKEKDYFNLRTNDPLEKDYFSVYDIFNIFLVCNIESFNSEYDLADRLVDLIMEVYIPLTPERYHDSINEQCSTLHDLWYFYREDYMERHPSEFKTLNFAV